MNETKTIKEIIEGEIARHRIINPKNMNLNEFLHVLTHLENLEEPFVNLNGPNHEFSFGFPSGFWPLRYRRLKVVKWEVIQDEDYEEVLINITGKEVKA